MAERLEDTAATGTPPEARPALRSFHASIDGAHFVPGRGVEERPVVLLDATAEPDLLAGLACGRIHRIRTLLEFMYSDGGNGEGFEARSLTDVLFPMVEEVEMIAQALHDRLAPSPRTGEPRR